MVSLKFFTLASALVASAAAANATIKYMPFGDSITEIVCWRAKLWEKMQTAGYTDVDFVGSGKNENPSGCKDSKYDRDNEGHSGFLAINIDKQGQLKGWLQKNPADVITMHLGTNDINGGHSTADIIASFTNLIDTMRASNPKMKIIVAQIIPLAIGGASTKVGDLNKAIPTWATSKNSTDSPIWVVDMNTGFPTSDLRDGVHPNDAGDQIMEERWYPFVTMAVDMVRAAKKAEAKKQVGVAFTA